MTARLEVSQLAVDYRVGRRHVRALDGVDLGLEPRQSLGIVGESGSGKSTLGLSLGGLLPPNARRHGGDVRVDGRSVFSHDAHELRAFRRERLGFVFQSPAAALDPTRRVGRQVRDLLGSNGDGLELLRRVGFADPAEVAMRFAHQLSGGMAQRVVIAMAIAQQPALIVADEPTAALDSSTRNQVLDLLFALPGELGASLVVLTHDLRSVATRCSHVAVMYAGRIVEIGAKDQVLSNPRHPYTAALLAATPGSEARGEELLAIGGLPPVLYGRSAACSYAPRCSLASDTCRGERPEPRAFDERVVACHHAEQVKDADIAHSGLATLS
jgi:peptide/nickel transport system ATP-binding protein